MKRKAKYHKVVSYSRLLEGIDFLLDAEDRGETSLGDPILAHAMAEIRCSVIRVKNGKFAPVQEKAKRSAPKKPSNVINSLVKSAESLCKECEDGERPRSVFTVRQAIAEIKKAKK